MDENDSGSTDISKRNHNSYVTFKHKGNTEKRKGTQFKKGHSHIPTTRAKNETIVRPIKRFDEIEHSFVVKSNGASPVEFSMPDALGIEGAAISLRPSPVKYQEINEEYAEIVDEPTESYYEVIQGNILVEKSRLCELINTSFHEHSLTTCNSFEFDIVKFKAWGCFCQAQGVCKNCSYTSSHVKLYDEVITHNRGRRAATGNIRLQVLLQDMPIGNVNAQLVVAALGVRPGSISSMQNLAYRTSDAAVAVNEGDMNKWREFIKEVQTNRGVKDPNHISGSYDVRYHGVFKKSNTTPGCGAIQATATLVENVTDHKKVVDIAYVNKYCPKGTRLNEPGGLSVKCGVPNSHEGCVANMPRWKHIGEGELAEEIAENIGEQTDLAVVKLVSDSDGKGIEGFRRENARSGETIPKTTWEKDLTHVSTNQRQKIMNAKFTRGVFGCKMNGQVWNSKEKKECQKALAHDVPYRCAIILRRVLMYYQYNMKRVKTTLPSIVEYMLNCYNGDHSKCDKTRVGKRMLFCTKENRWFQRSPHLCAQRVMGLSMKNSDKLTLKQTIDMKLGVDTIDFFKNLDTSSKNEAVNRAIKHSCPDNVTFARVGIGRTHSAVLKCNNGILTSTGMKLQYLKCSLPEVTKRVLKKYMRKSEKVKEYKKNSKHRRDFLRKTEINEYYQKNRLQKVNNDEYCKYQLDEAIADKAKAFDDLDIDATQDLAMLEKTLSRCAIQSQNLMMSVQYHDECDAVQRRKRTITKKRKSKAAKVRITKQKLHRQSQMKEMSEHSYGLCV